MLLPNKQYLDTLRHLRGAPKVSYPYGPQTTTPVIERVYSVPKGRVDDIPGTLSEFSGSVLTVANEIGRDQTDVEVYVKYEVLPGTLRYTVAWDEEIGALIIDYKQRVLNGDAILAVGSAYDPLGLASAHVISSQFIEDTTVLTSAVVGTLLTRVMNLDSTSRREALSGSEPMPDIVTLITGWTYDPACRFQPPFLGVHYLLEHHLPANPLFCAISYTIGKNTSPAIEDIALWNVKSGESRIGLPIGRNTLHDDYTAAETGACTWNVEVMPESVPAPSAYVTGDEYTFNATEHPVRGGPAGVWERREYIFVAT